MALNVSKVIKKQLKEYDSNLDTSDSSALMDLLVSPIDSILSPFYRKLLINQNQLSLSNYENLSDEQLEDRASDFFISRVEGAKATGSVRIYMDSPRDITIFKGTEFSTGDNKKFITTRNYSITRSLMLGNLDRYPLYDSGPIPVEALLQGIDNEASPNEIKSAIGITGNYNYVTNPIAITGGEARESNAQLYQKMLDAKVNKSLLSPKGIERTLLENFTTIKSIEVKGIGDDEMLRDLTYSGDTFTNSFTSDFFGALSGLHDYPYNQSIAYYDYFSNTTLSGLALAMLPEPSDFVFSGLEWTNNMYLNIFRNNADRTTVRVDVIFSDNFSSSTTLSQNWILSDGLQGKGVLGTPNLRSIDEIKLDTTNDRVVLGKVGTITSNITYLTPYEVEKLRSLVTDALDNPPVPNA